MVAAASGCLGEAPAAGPVATQTVDIPGPWVFEPSVAQVRAGEPVTFTNHGGADHTVTFTAVDLDETIPPGGETTYTFDKPGTYEYVCKLHPPDMKGTIIVKADES